MSGKRVSAKIGHDTTPPSAPGNLRYTGRTQTSVSISWSASSDNVRVVGYKPYRNGTVVGDNKASSSLSYTFTGLACGTSSAFGVEAYDRAGNVSPSAISASTSACTSPTPAPPPPPPPPPPPSPPPPSPPPPPPSNGPCVGASAPTSYDHVVWIVFENKQYTDIFGNANANYINGIASQCGLATNFFAEAHPSLPNYIAMTSGSTQGITDDSGPSSHPLSVPSIFSQLGTGWRSLEESMTSNCNLGNTSLYAVRHNPAAYYTNIRTQCSAQDVALTDPPNLSAKFTFITANLCDDMHSCPTTSDKQQESRNGDAWLAIWLPKMLASPEFAAGRTVIFITWDEDDYSSSQHIVTVVVSPTVKSGTRSGVLYNHYSMLRTTEEMLGLPQLAGASTATSMRAGFGI